MNIKKESKVSFNKLRKLGLHIDIHLRHMIIWLIQILPQHFIILIFQVNRLLFLTQIRVKSIPSWWVSMWWWWFFYYVKLLIVIILLWWFSNFRLWGFWFQAVWGIVGGIIIDIVGNIFVIHVGRLCEIIEVKDIDMIFFINLLLLFCLCR